MIFVLICSVLLLIDSSCAVEQTTQVFLGCYTDDATSPDLDGWSVTMTSPSVDQCCLICRNAGFPYCGLQNGVMCMCGAAFGKYGPSTECDYSGCSATGCGGASSNSIYYSLVSQGKAPGVKMLTMKTPLKYTAARQTCVQKSGDLASPYSLSSISRLVQSAANQTDVWVGLRKRIPTEVYEWTEEFLAKSYIQRVIEFNTYWGNTSNLFDCVSMNIASVKFIALDCSTPLPYVCDLFSQPDENPGSTDDVANNSTGGEPTDEGSAVNPFLLYVLMPFFLFCYAGSCVFYCVYRISSNCRKDSDSQDQFIKETKVPANDFPPNYAYVATKQPVVAPPMENFIFSPAKKPEVYQPVEPQAAPAPAPVVSAPKVRDAAWLINSMKNDEADGTKSINQILVQKLRSQQNK